tara:strand:+ start:971 stop:1156 length:186 start_codon:yes stop_codon:yes gene_type:complete
MNFFTNEFSFSIPDIINNIQNNQTLFPETNYQNNPFGTEQTILNTGDSVVDEDSDEVEDVD